jgi:hypothetical protein
MNRSLKHRQMGERGRMKERGKIGKDEKRKNK